MKADLSEVPVAQQTQSPNSLSKIDISLYKSDIFSFFLDKLHFSGISGVGRSFYFEEGGKANGKK
jgi:hypothetical protein